MSRCLIRLPGSVGLTGWDLAAREQDDVVRERGTFPRRAACRRQTRRRPDLLAVGGKLGELAGGAAIDRLDPEIGEWTLRRECLERRRAVFDRSRRLGRPRQAEGEDFRSTRRQDDVCRLQIAVENPFGVRCGQRVGQRKTGVDERDGVHRTTTEALVQRLALEQFHDEERHWRRADVIDGADAWMVERGNGLGLALESSKRLR